MVQGVVRGQILLAGPGYTESFDTLSASGTANAWVDNATVPGWYAGAVNGFNNDYRAGSGTATTGDLYSFGTSADRALGSLASATTGEFAYGVRLKNSTGSDLSGFSVGYVGEQWRDSSTSAQSLVFSYKTSSTPMMSSEPGNSPGAGGWIAFPALDFTSPQVSGVGALDGNVAVNRLSFISVSLTGVTLGAGEELFLRWSDLNDAGSDHAMAIDSFSLTYAAVPEPEVATWVTGMVLMMGWWIQRRRKAGKRA